MASTFNKYLNTVEIDASIKILPNFNAAISKGIVQASCDMIYRPCSGVGRCFDKGGLRYSLPL